MSKKPKKPPAHARAPKSVSELQSLLREHDLRSTASRIAVLSLLHQRQLQLQRAASPLSHAEVFDALAGRGFDRATVYRNLTDLAEKGIVTRSDCGDHVWRFELRRGNDAQHAAAHPHFVCKDCGDVSCLPEVAVRVASGHPTPRAVAARAIEVQLKGLCDNCTA